MLAMTTPLKRQAPLILPGWALVAASVGCWNVVHEPVGFAPLGFVSLAPLLLVFWGRRPPVALTWGLLFGMGTGLPLGSWVLDAMKASFPDHGAPVLGWTLAAAWTMGLPMAALGSLASLTRGLGPIPRCLAFGGIAFAVDWTRSTAPGLIPFGLIGHPQAGLLGVAQVAVIGGVPLVSALTAVCNAAVTALILDGCTAALTRFAAATLGSVVALALAGLPAAEWSRESWQPPHPSSRVLIVQPAIPVEARWAPHAQGTHLQHLMNVTRLGLERAEVVPDLVVWPESILTGSVEQGTDLQRRLTAAIPSIGIPTLFGGIRTGGSPDRYRAAAFQVDPSGTVDWVVEKAVGMPLAESGRFWGSEALRSWLGMSESWVLDEGEAGGVGASRYRYATVLCYEMLFPGLVSQRAGDDALFLAYLASDMWAGGEAMQEQVLAVAVFRAIEQRLPLVRVSDGGSAALDAYGRVIAELPASGSASHLVSLPGGPRRTASESVVLGAVALGGALLGCLTLSAAQRRRSVMSRARAAVRLGVVCFLLASPARGQEQVATLTLDGLSYLSVEGHAAFEIPAGSTIELRFGRATGDSVPFTISPDGVKIAPVRFDENTQLLYSLASASPGTLKRATDGTYQIDLSATVAVTSTGPDGTAYATYPVRLTTERASAPDRQKGGQVEIDGLRVAPASRYVQLVAAATNRGDAMLGAGAAVRSVLSGTFDRLPELAASTQ